LVAPPDGSLVFTRIGYLPTEVAIAGQARVDVAIEVSAAELQQILVTGYSSQRRADITGAVASVNMQSLGRETSSSVLQRLSGNVSGVTVDASGSPGARSTVRIRGVSSFQNNNPLYIIDGTPIQDSFANWLNPNDIESIQVLKDASAASIYGSRANNGVVIIETKKGRVGAPQFHLDAKFGVATPVRGYDDFLILDALEYHEFVRLSHINAGEPVPRHMYGDPDNPTLPRYIFPNDGINQTMSADEAQYAWENSNRLITPASPGTNWWKAVFGPANVYDVNLRVSGGSATERYNLGLNYFNQEGTAAYNRFQRGTIRINTDFNLGRLTFGENLNLSLDEHFGGMTNDPGGFAENTVVGKNVMMQPIVPIYDVGGNFASSKGPELGNHDNPLKRAWAEKDNVTRNVRLFGNVFGRLDLLERASLNTRFGFNLGQGSTTGFNHITPENSEPNLVYSMFENTNRFTDWTWTNTLNLSRSYGGQHNMDVLLGQEASRASNRFITAGMSAIVTTDINARYINDAIGDPSTQNVSSSGGFSTLLSYFGKVDYNYAERYYASVTVRHDGSSRLGPTNRWGTFPAFSLGWRVSQEPFLAPSTFFTNIPAEQILRWDPVAMKVDHDGATGMIGREYRPGWAKHI
jgi:TonB-dependent starch-binding outer membrane protein SusC